MSQSTQTDFENDFEYDLRINVVHTRATKSRELNKTDGEKIKYKKR